MLRLEASAFLGVRSEHLQLLAILVALLDAHELMAINLVPALFCVVRGVRPVLGPIAILGRIVSAILISHTITVAVSLPALDLGTITRTIGARAASLAFRKSIL